MDRSILYVNACVRKESRTKRLAEKLLFKLGEPYEELCLEKIAFPLVNEEYLNKRDQLISSGNFQSPMFDLARQFSEEGVPVALCRAKRLFYVTTYCP